MYLPNSNTKVSDLTVEQLKYIIITEVTKLLKNFLNKGVSNG